MNTAFCDALGSIRMNERPDEEGIETGRQKDVASFFLIRMNERPDEEGIGLEY